MNELLSILAVNDFEYRKTVLTIVVVSIGCLALLFIGLLIRSYREKHIYENERLPDLVEAGMIQEEKDEDEYEYDENGMMILNDSVFNLSKDGPKQDNKNDDNSTITDEKPDTDLTLLDTEDEELNKMINNDTFESYFANEPKHKKNEYE